MNYLEHLIMNIKVSLKCLAMGLWYSIRAIVRGVVMSTWHAAHGVLPVKYTSHDWWGVDKNNLTSRKKFARVSSWVTVMINNNQWEESFAWQQACMVLSKLENGPLHSDSKKLLKEIN